MTNYGLNDTLKYTEFEFDSLTAGVAADSKYSPQDWPLFLLGKPLSNVAAIKVLDAQIPFSFYIFNPTNNTFTLTETVSASPSSATVTIPIGNYTSTTILPALILALHTASPHSFTYTVTYSSTNYLLTFACSDTVNGDTFALTFGTATDIGQSNPRLWLGFTPGVSTSSVVTSSTAYTATLTAPNVIQLTGPNYIYICSRYLGQMVRLYLPAGSNQGNYNYGADGPQICRLPLSVNSGFVIDYTDPDPQKWFDLENLTNFAQVDFYCTMGTMQETVPIDFNGSSFSLKLGILINDNVHNDYLGGGKQNDRVVNRTWGVGAGMMKF